MDWLDKKKLERNNVTIEILEVMLEHKACFYDFLSRPNKEKVKLSWKARVSKHFSHTFDHYYQYEIIRALSALYNLNLVEFRRFNEKTFTNLKGGEGYFKHKPQQRLREEISKVLGELEEEGLHKYELDFQPKKAPLIKLKEECSGAVQHLRVGYYTDEILYRKLDGLLEEFSTVKYSRVGVGIVGSRLIYLNQEEFGRLIEKTNIPKKELEEIAEIEDSNKNLLYETLESEKVI